MFPVIIKIPDMVFDYFKEIYDSLRSQKFVARLV